MCGRFVFYSDPQFLREQYGFDDGPIEFRPQYNIAPTQPVLTVTNYGQRTAEYMRWGLIPSWTKDLKKSRLMINARAETAAKNGAFRTPLQQRRCLVLADGFYEWRQEGETKVPNYIFLKSRKVLAFAGLWDEWKSPEQELIRSCTIVTTEANAFMEPIHNRMPVILSEETEALWLDPLTSDPAVLQPILTSYPSELMNSYEVATSVNSWKNDGPECITPV